MGTVRTVIYGIGMFAAASLSFLVIYGWRALRDLDEKDTKSETEARKDPL